MPAISRSVATLRVFGDSLVPEEITAKLGAEPTSCHRKGETERMRSGRDLVHKTGMWRLEATSKEPEDLDSQIAELLFRLSADLEVWRTLSANYTLDLFCGLFMDQSNEGLSLSPLSMSALGERRIEIAFDVYAPARELQLAEECPCSSGKPYGECCAPKPAA